MPRAKLIRRFEPRFGVSQTMLETESRYVGQELEDYLLLSLEDLRRTLRERQDAVGRAEEGLQKLLATLPDRRRLALRCMLARDAMHIGALYETAVRGLQSEDLAGPAAPAPEELTEEDELRQAVPFSEWLFQL